MTHRSVQQSGMQRTRLKHPLSATLRRATPLRATPRRATLGRATRGQHAAHRRKLSTLVNGHTGEPNNLKNQSKQGQQAFKCDHENFLVN